MGARSSQSSAPAVLAGGGEMGALVRAHDWAATPLGPIQRWPQSLRTTVQTALAAPFPTVVLWGPELIQVYNDGYRALMGVKHPAGLGQPTRACWPEAWHINGPIYARVRQGESLAFEDARYPVTRSGALEDAWFTLSYSPLRDEAGAVAGVLVTVFETTERLRAEAALRESREPRPFMAALGDALRPLADSAAIQGEACRLLGERLGARRAYYAEVREAEDCAVVEQDYVRDGLPSLAGRIPLASFRWVLPLYARGRPIVVDDLQTSDPVPDPDRAAMAAVQIIAWIAIPLVKDGALVGALCVGEPEPRAWRAAEVALVEATAERIWATVERARAEAALRESRARLQLALDTADMGTFMWYPQEDRAEPDARLLALFGLPPDGGINLASALAGLIHPDDRARYAAAVARACDPAGPGALAEEFRVRRPDGTERWLHITGQVQFEGEPPRAARMPGTALDITERKRREEREQLLLTLGDMLRPLADAADVKAVASRLLGEQLEVDRAAYAEFLPDGESVATEGGWLRPGVPSLDGDYRSVDVAAFFSDLHDGATATIEDVLTELGDPPGSEARHGRLPGVRAAIAYPVLKHGRLVAACFVHSAAPRRWRDDEVALVAEVGERAWAAVERARAEAALRASEAQLEADLSDARLLQGVSTRLISESNVNVLYEHILDAAVGIMRSEYGSMQLLYPERGNGGELGLLAHRGFSPRAAACWAWVGADSASSCGAALRAGERVVVPDVERCEFIAGTASLANYLGAGIHAAQTTPLVARDGRLLGMLSTHWREPHQPSERDLTLLDILARQAADLIERRLAEHAQVEARRMAEQARAAAEEAARSREEFLSIASHELRNPVATLSGTAQLLRRARANGRLTDERLGTYLDALERAGAHLSTLTNDLLDVSRLQRGELPLRPAPVDVAELLRDIVQRSEWPDHRVTLDAAEGPLDAVIDADRIRQVVANLLENAVKYSPGADEARVRLLRADGGLLIEVQDFGIGLPAGAAESIFTPFQRAPNAAAAGIPGLGLGLFIARRIAEQHGGRLLARSDGEGRGAVMSLWLPLTPQRADSRSRGDNGHDA